MTALHCHRPAGFRAREPCSRTTHRTGTTVRARNEGTILRALQTQLKTIMLTPPVTAAGSGWNDTSNGHNGARSKRRQYAHGLDD
eukprot:scaffold23603_cov54-Phaeocystis_antarctica.AAC.2